jgi:hypothetical protein
MDKEILEVLRDSLTMLANNGGWGKTELMERIAGLIEKYQGDNAALPPDVPLASGEPVSGDAAPQHSALKPCPFCGSSAIHDYDEQIKGHFIRCSMPCGADPLVHHFDKDSTFAAWNRRAPLLAAPHQNAAPSSEGLVDDQPLIDALGEAVNAASINGSDYPHTVIEKYQRALLPLLRAALKGGEK